MCINIAQDQSNSKIKLRITTTFNCKVAINSTYYVSQYHIRTKRKIVRSRLRRSRHRCRCLTAEYDIFMSKQIRNKNSNDNEWFNECNPCEWDDLVERIAHLMRNQYGFYVLIDAIDDLTVPTSIKTNANIFIVWCRNRNWWATCSMHKPQRTKHYECSGILCTRATYTLYMSQFTHAVEWTTATNKNIVSMTY